MPASPSGFTVTHVSAQTYQVAGTYSPAATVRLWQNGFYIKDALCDTSGNFSTTITLDPGRRKVYLTGSVSGSTNESASSDVVTVHVPGGVEHRDIVRNKHSVPLELSYWTPAGFESVWLSDGESFTLPMGTYCTDLGLASRGHVRLGHLVIYRLHAGTTTPVLLSQGIPALKVRASRPKVVDGFLFMPLSATPSIVSTTETQSLSIPAGSMRTVSVACRPNSRPASPVTIRVMLSVAGRWYISTAATSKVVSTTFPLNSRNFERLAFALHDTNWDDAAFVPGTATTQCAFSKGSQNKTWAQVKSENPSGMLTGIGFYTDSVPLTNPDGGVLNNVLFDDVVVTDQSENIKYHQRFYTRWSFDAYAWRENASGTANPYQYTNWRGDTPGSNFVPRFAVVSDSGIGEQRPGDPNYTPLAWPSVHTKFIPGSPTLDNAPSDLSWLHAEVYRENSLPASLWQIHNSRPDIVLVEAAPGREAPVDVGFQMYALNSWSGVGIKLMKDAGPDATTVDILFRSVDALFFGVFLRLHVKGTSILSWEYLLDDGKVAEQPRHRASRLTSTHGQNSKVHCTINTPFEYQIQGTDNPNYFAMLQLPPGLQMNPSGLVYGMLTVPLDYYSCWAVVGNEWGNGSGEVRISTGLTPVLPFPPLGQYDGSVAFSVRRLSFANAYTGPCLRVRRSSDNAEQDIGFDSSGWLDETAILAFVGSGNGFVVAWYNQSPQFSLEKFIQPDATKQPRVVISGALYKVGAAQRPAIKFEGTGWLRTETENALKILSVDGETHLSAAYYVDVSANEQVVFCQQANQGGYRVQSLVFRYIYPINSWEQAKSELGHNFAVTNIRVDSGYPYLSVPVPSAMNVHRFIALNGNNQSCDFFWQGTKRATVSGLLPMPNKPLNSVAKHSYIGCHFDQATYILRCSLHEVIVMSKSWTDEETINLSLNQAGAFS